MVLPDDFLGEGQDLRGGLRIEGRGMLVQQKQMRTLERRHQQGQGLALTTGQETDLTGHTALEAEPETLECILIELTLLLGNRPAKTSALPSAEGERHILLDLHVGGRALHRILEYTSDVLRALALRLLRDVLTIDLDDTGIDRIGTGDHIEKGRLAGPITADDGHEITIVQGQVDATQCLLFIDGSLVKGLSYILDH